jgi:Prp8 binding protein
MLMMLSQYGVLKPPTPKSTPLSILFSRVSGQDQRLYASFSCGSVITYLLKTGQPIRRHRGAKGCVNSLDVTTTSRELIVTGGDDGKVRVWDVEEKEPVETIELGYPITAVAWSADGQQVFIAGLDNDVHVCFD